jgi:hypothetical protein
LLLLLKIDEHQAILLLVKEEYLLMGIEEGSLLACMR